MVHPLRFPRLPFPASAQARALFVVLVFCGSVFGGCSRSAPPLERTEQANVGGAVPATSRASSAERPHEARLTADVIAAADIRTAPVERRPWSARRTLSGELAADPDRTARLSSPVAGRIEEVRFQEGARVRRGDVVALVRVPELGRLRGARAGALARARAARANATRLSGLSQSALATEQEYLDARAEAEAQEAEAAALDAQMQAMGAHAGAAIGGGAVVAIRAPSSGVVIARDAVVGQPLAADQVIGTVADLSELWFLARVFERDLGSVRVGAAAEVRLSAFPEEPFVGTIELVGRRVDPKARTITARVRLTNRDDLLRVGLFGTAAIGVAPERGDAAPPALVVPRDAVTTLGREGETVVFVRDVDDEAVFRARPVELARGGEQGTDGFVALEAGVREGESVVTRGVFTLKSVLAKGELAEDD